MQVGAFERYIFLNTAFIVSDDMFKLNKKKKLTMNRIHSGNRSCWCRRRRHSG